LWNLWVFGEKMPTKLIELAEKQIWLRWIFNRRISINALWAIYVLLNFCIYLNYSIGTPICFDDCQGYIGLMGRPLNGEYVHILRRMFRAWFVPVFFSLFGKYSLASAMSIVLAQTVILYISWIVFATVVARQFEGRLSKVVFLILSLSVYGQHYFVLNAFLLSDSLALSSLLLFLSVCIGFGSLWESAGFGATTGVLLLTALIASGSRDANLLFIVLWGAYVLLRNYRHLKSWQNGVIVAGLLTICIFQYPHASKRHMVNMKNLMVGFVLPNPAVSSFFVRHGMPASLDGGATLKPQKWCSADIREMEQRLNRLEISDKQLKQASRIYAWWLLAHPGYVMRQALADRECILGQSVARERTSDALFTHPGDKVTTIQEGVVRLALSDYFGVSERLIAALSISCLFLAIYPVRRSVYMPMCVFLVTSGLADAVSAYFSDLWEPGEMIRHALIGAVIFNVGFLVSAVSLVEFVRWRIPRTHDRSTADPVALTLDHVR